MTELTRDPVFNIIHNCIKRSIRILLANECFRGAILLIYSGIDTMAFLDMPCNQKEVQSKDFIKWADRYIRFPCNEQLTGEEMYSARCGMLHSYSPYSRSTRDGRCRIVGYVDKSVPEIRYDPNVSKELVLVSVVALSEAFFLGVDQFLIDLYSDAKKAATADERFNFLVQCLPAY